jgi:hypothetical protein
VSNDKEQTRLYRKQKRQDREQQRLDGKQQRLDRPTALISLGRIAAEEAGK